MKKALITIVITLLLGGAGAGYYFFFMQKDLARSETGQSLPQAQPPEGNAQPIMDLEVQPHATNDYYVIDRQLSVYNKPDQSGLVVDTLYKGEKVTALEKDRGWYRISDYLVYKEGGVETAEWLNAQGLSNSEPVIQEQERLEILDGYLQKSDDYKRHLDMFREKTQGLLDDNTCEPEDFEELGGWVRSVTYQQRNVYFIYCGGLEQENKLYLDVDSGETFYR